MSVTNFPCFEEKTTIPVGHYENATNKEQKEKRKRG
jgi:hypothetical protein